MATDEQKKQNQVRLMSMTLGGMAAGIWDMVEESSVAMGPSMGEQILQVMEKEMGLELGGENAGEVLHEMGRLFVDEFGFAQEVDIEEGPEGATMLVHNCLLLSVASRLKASGVDPFICPYRNVVAAAAKRGHIKMRATVDVEPENRKCLIGFRAV